MSKVFLFTKLIMFLSLISICLSFGVITHQFNKNPLDSGDKRFNNALSLFTKKVVEKKGGARNIKVVPVAAFRNFDNGLNYKLLAAVTDIKIKNTDFVETNIYSDNEGGFFVYSDSVESTLKTYNVNRGLFMNEITEFLRKQLIAKKISIKKVNSILGTYIIANHTTYYAVDMAVESEGKTYEKNIVMSLSDGGDFEVLNSLDFPII